MRERFTVAHFCEARVWCFHELQIRLDRHPRSGGLPNLRKLCSYGVMININLRGSIVLRFGNGEKPPLPAREESVLGKVFLIYDVSLSSAFNCG